MGLFDWLRPAPPLAPETRERVQQAVAAVEPAICSVAGYQRRLAPAVEHAWGYCTGLAGRIPGPVEINRGAFATDPLVHALFGTADDIDAMLGRSQCVRDHLVAGSGPILGQCWALLGMRHHEKASFGPALAGGLLQTDQPQRLLYFDQHTLAEPSPDLPSVQRRLASAMFDGLLKGLAEHVNDVRAERAGLYQAEALEKTRQLVAGGEAGSHTRRLAELRERLLASADALSPPRLLETLEDCLSSPEPYLQLRPLSLAVDRAGIIHEDAAGAPASERLDFVELIGRDQRRWVVMLARIDRDEARRAVERVDEARRHIVI